MNRNLLFGLLLVMVVAVAACAAPADTTDTTTPTEDTAPAEDTTPEEGSDADTPTGDVIAESQPDVTIQVTGENFAFFVDGERNPDITVQQGDLVRIEFTSTQGFHDWMIDEFNAATAQVRDTEGMTAVEFVADQTGSFEYYCSVGSHRANGMFGTLIVE